MFVLNKGVLKEMGVNATQMRVAANQYKMLNEAYRQGSAEDLQGLLNHLNAVGANAARTPAEAYREFDPQSKIFMVPAGEFATLTRLLQKARGVDLGREVYEYRQVSEMDEGQSSMSGQTGVSLDKTIPTYDGTVVPIHQKGYGRRFREILAMRADGYDALVEDAREARRSLMKTLDSYLWDGNANLALKNHSWLGIRNDPSIATATLGVDLAASASGSQDIRNEVSRIRDILYITNNCTNPLRLGVSREILSNWERPFSTAEGTFGTIGEYVGKLRGISEIYEDSQLVGNQIALYWDDQMGFHPVSGMGMSSYMVPRNMPISDHSFIMMAATGFLAKVDSENHKCALYATS